MLALRLARQLSAAHNRAALKLLMPAAYDGVCCSRIGVVQNGCVGRVFFFFLVCVCECEPANKPAACQDFGAGSKMLPRS